MALTGAGPVYDESYTSTGAITQYSAVKLAALDVVGLSIGSSGTAAAAIGIVQNGTSANGPATVRRFGLSKGIASAAIAVNDPLTSTTDGRLATAGTTGQYVFARACSASTAAGQTISVMVHTGYMFAGSTA